MISSWGAPLIILLLGTGIYFTWRLKLLQLDPAEAALFRSSSAKRKRKKKAMYPAFRRCAPLCPRRSAQETSSASPLRSWPAVPARCSGCGSARFFGMATKYAEGLLAIRYRTKDEEGNIAGGPMYLSGTRPAQPIAGKALSRSSAYAWRCWASGHSPRSDPSATR